MTLTVFLTVYILLCWVYITCADSFCADDLADWTVTITNQSELNQFLNNATSRDNIRCVHLSLAAGNSYKLDIVKFMQINLEHNASLIVVGEGGGVDINCTASLSDLEELRKLNLSLSRASLVMLDGLVFTSCPLPIVIEEVLTVVINNCHFLHHEHGAVSIYNSQDVTVKNCKFLNNTSDSYFTGRPYQGAAGGLSIGHYSVVSNVQLNNISILITDCNFTGNFASPPSNLTVTSTEVLMNQIITGRGGAVIVLVNVDTPFHFVTRNSFFLNNVADNIGGVFYCLTNGGKINQTFMFHNSVFIGNSGSSAGAVAFIILLNRPVDFVVHYIVRNCTFTDNLANSGVGGATTFSSLYGIPNIFSLFEYCIFINNTAALSGGAVDITSYNFFETRNVIPVIFRNCVFDGNVAVTGSAINLAYYSVTIDGVTFVDNKGTTVAANKGQMFFHGSVKFHGNMVNETFGGALDLLYSEMILTNDTHIEFKYNTAYIGAAISADGPRKVVPVFHKNHYNRLCFLRYHNSLVPLAQLDPHKVSMTFTGNDAIVGSDIYADHLDYCSWYSNSHPYFQSNMRNIFRWPFISYDKNEYTNHKMVSTDTSMPVISSTTDFLVLNNTVKAYPGEQINIIIIPYDEQKFTSFAIFEIKDLESLNSQRNPGFGFDFTPTVQFMYPGKSNYFVTSNIVTDNAAAITSTLLENTHVIQVSRSFEPDKVHQFNLTITPCPPGHTLRRNDLEDLYSCGCNDEKNIDIVNCLPGTRKLIIKDGYWAHRIKDINVNGELIYHWCPPGYCRCTSLDDVTGTCSSVYYFDNDDLQCVCDREGHLCGKCHANKGVSVLLDKCVDCGYDHAMLIVGLGTANVIVIIVILLSHATLLAWLYPFLYYIQVTPYIAKYFPLTFGAIQPYLHYISSTISLYFPYDFCLYPGMTALVSYTIRYIPFVLTTVIAVIFHIINRKAPMATNIWVSQSGLWLLIMLLYTDVVNTSVSVLNCRGRYHRNNELRWYVDGTVECFTGRHLALAVFAVLVLTQCVVLIVVVMAIAVGKLKSPVLRKVLQSPFVGDCCWWAPIELIRRLLFITFVVIDPGNLAPVLLLTMTCVAVYAYYQPYQKQYINVLEIVILVDQLLLLMMAPTSQFKDVVYGADHSFSIDQCGHVDTISTHVAILTPFYYFPVVVLCVVVVVKITAKIPLKFAKWKNKKQPSAIHIEAVTTICQSAPTTYYFELNDEAEYIT